MREFAKQAQPGITEQQPRNQRTIRQAHSQDGCFPCLGASVVEVFFFAKDEREKREYEFKSSHELELTLFFHGN